jgi:hypothetical protein
VSYLALVDKTESKLGWCLCTCTLLSEDFFFLISFGKTEMWLFVRTLSRLLDETQFWRIVCQELAMSKINYWVRQNKGCSGKRWVTSKWQVMLYLHRRWSRWPGRRDLKQGSDGCEVHQIHVRNHNWWSRNIHIIIYTSHTHMHTFTCTTIYNRTREYTAFIR